jgi:hypothetical protein
MSKSMHLCQPYHSKLTSTALERIVLEIAVSISKRSARPVKSCGDPLVGVEHITVVVDELLEVLVVIAGVTCLHFFNCTGTESLDGTRVCVAGCGVIRVRQSGIASFDCEYTDSGKACNISKEGIENERTTSRETNRDKSYTVELTPIEHRSRITAHVAGQTSIIQNLVLNAHWCRTLSNFSLNSTDHNQTIAGIGHNCTGVNPG